MFLLIERISLAAASDDILGFVALLVGDFRTLTTTTLGVQDRSVVVWCTRCDDLLLKVRIDLCFSYFIVNKIATDLRGCWIFTLLAVPCLYFG